MTVCREWGAGRYESRICGQWGNFRVNLSQHLVKMDGKTWVFMAYGWLEDTRMGCREKDRVPPSSTLVYILAHGCCQRLRAGHWAECHDERPSMEAPSSRSDETEMNHDHFHSCCFQQGSAHDFSLPCMTSAGVWPSKITNLASVTSH